MVKSGSDDYYHGNVLISNVNSAYRKDILLKYRFIEDIVMAEDKILAAQILTDGGTIIYEPLAVAYNSHDHRICDAFDKLLNYGLWQKQGVSRLPKSRRSIAGRTGSYLSTEIKFLKRLIICAGYLTP